MNPHHAPAGGATQQGDARTATTPSPAPASKEPPTKRTVPQMPSSRYRHPGDVIHLTAGVASCRDHRRPGAGRRRPARSRRDQRGLATIPADARQPSA